jgi:aspartokinase
MAHNFSVMVQKYGGSSVAEPHKIKAVAHFIKSSLTEHHRICVVVSAMGNTTNELIKLAQNVAIDPPKRELDMLISCGERSSMALLAMALDDIGVSAISLTGSQSGIITDNNHNGAEIIEIKPGRVFEALNTHQVVIVAGFQGISLNKEITTLRRGGSDTTAIAMAAALKASACEIYTDVAGVMDIDPKIALNAQLLPNLSFDQMEAMALYGARVLAHDAIRLAKNWGVKLRIAQAGEAVLGTTIDTDNSASSEQDVVAITHLRGIMQFSIRWDHVSTLKNRPGYFLCGVMRNEHFVGYVSNDLSQELVHKDIDVNAGLALITLHLEKNQAAILVLSKITDIMATHKINFKDILVGRNEIFMVISDDQLNTILLLLYAAVRTRENAHGTC